MFIICINKLALKIMKKNRNDFVANPIYYKLGGKTMNECFFIISEYCKHDTAAVHLFNKKLIAYLKKKFWNDMVIKLMFFSDGCAAQYKNKSNFTNLLYQKTDFGVKSEWYFF